MLVTPWLAQEVASFWLLCVKGFSDDQSHISLCSHSSSAWQSVERDLRNQVSGGDRGFVEEYVEKQPSNNLKCGTSDLSGCCPGRLSRNTVTGQRGSSGSHWKRMPTASIVQTAARRREKKWAPGCEAASCHSRATVVIPARGREARLRAAASLVLGTAFKPVDLNDLKRRSTQDPKKS
ncbi:hypothetical protein AB205_0206660 [Aquarana catesbeiana]|uniref:Uncharacterized protein n=1 Tax=Aquarana catesbeiana TaxID=8400 RepID=A0A2G9R6H4_AQUCT|nr:hypothetical protein AB205_0206660 [Aquarana catesbeiana]